MAGKSLRNTSLRSDYISYIMVTEMLLRHMPARTVRRVCR